MTKTPIPLRPDYAAAAATARNRGVNAITRAVAALAWHQTHRSGPTPSELLAEHWGEDRDAALILKTAVTPSTMSSASALMTSGVPELIASLGAVSAAAALLGRGMQLQNDRPGVFVIPSVKSAAANASFIAEGAAVPVRALTFSSLMLEVKSLKCIAVFTREIFERSIPNIETLVRSVLTESIGLTLDSILFGTAAASSSAPAGLRNGIAATAVGTTDPRADLTTLHAAVAAIAGAVQPVVCCNPVQAAALRNASPPIGYDVLATAGLSAGVVAMIAPNALASVMDTAPRFEIADSASLHMDTSPTDFGISGVLATPSVKSLWQTDSVGLRVVLKTDWGLRDVGGLAWLSAAGW
jgi:hypothetical protein